VGDLDWGIWVTATAAVQRETVYSPNHRAIRRAQDGAPG
jgi:hypothetical protein